MSMIASVEDTRKLVAFHPLSLAEEESEDSNDRVVKTRLAKALACLGVKPSTFQALSAQKKFDDLEALLKDAMVQMNASFQNRDALGNHLDLPEKHGIKIKKEEGVKEYSPYLNKTADFPTILEAYQYLIKKYVINARERQRKLQKAKNFSSAIAAFQQGIDKERKKALIQREQDEREMKLLEVIRDEIFEEDEETSEEEELEEEELEDCQPLSYKISKESDQMTKEVFDQFKDLNIIDPRHDSSRSVSRRASIMSIEGNGGSVSSGSGRGSVRRSSLTSQHAEKALQRRKSLHLVQTARAFMPKQEEKLLLKYRSTQTGRRPSSIF